MPFIQVHHVVERATGITQLLYDLAFLASGVLFLAIGGALIRSDRKRLDELNLREIKAA